jgi:hypothetical protein
MSQYDAAATAMWRSFSATPDVKPFTALPESVNLDDLNPGKGKLAAMAKGLDFSKEDLVPDAIMNAMLWKAVRGENAVTPAPVRAAFFQGRPVRAKDND